ncbi:AMP-binding protein [Streptomyces sp. JNUCC 63]
MAMTDAPLDTWLPFGHVPRRFHDTEIVSSPADGGPHRCAYADFGRRTQWLMHALDSLGPERGDRAATLAWNGHRRLEAYRAAPCTGRVLHTLDVRLSADHLAYIIGHGLGALAGLPRPP